MKPTLLVGLGLLGVTSLAFGFANHIVVLDAARFVQGIGGAFMWAAGMTWLLSAAPADRRGELIGSALAAAIVGVLLGPVLGGAATVVGPEVVFTGVSVVAAGLAAWAWRTPGVVPEPSSGLAALVGALRRRDVLIGFWLFTVPALLSGVIEVLAPLRLDELGATGAAIGAIFLVTAAVEGVLSPVAGRVSDRHGRLAPIRFGLLGAIVMSALLPLPNNALLLGMAVLLTFAALGAFWAPALAWLSDASEDAGLDLAFAFSISNLAWAMGHVVGSSAGGAIADATADAVPYGMLGAICAVTLIGVISLGRNAPARSPAAP